VGGWFSAGRGGVSEGLNGVICSCVCMIGMRVWRSCV